MIRRLPSWAWVGAWLLASIAGMVDVIAMSSFTHIGVSHHSGNTTLFGAALALGDWAAAVHLLGVMLAFVAGTATSGFIVQDSVLRLGHRYGVSLLIESSLLLVAAWLMQRGEAAGLYVAAGASGMQNAMVSTYSGSLVRTTHLTGMYTDIGLAIGHALRGLPVDGRRMVLAVTVISGFLAGAVAGGIGFAHFRFAWLLLPAGVSAFTALAYMAVLARRGG